MAIDYTTARGQVRAMIPDITEGDFVLSDGQIDAMLAVNSDNVKMALAAAWRAIATETSLLLKYVRTDDLLVDGPKMADTLLKNADKMEAAGTAEIIQGESEAFSITPYKYTLEDSWGSLGRAF